MRASSTILVLLAWTLQSATAPNDDNLIESLTLDTVIDLVICIGCLLLLVTNNSIINLLFVPGIPISIHVVGIVSNGVFRLLVLLAELR